MNGRGLRSSHEANVDAILGRIAFLELVPPVLARALEPFPVPIRTLDALHLAAIDFLRRLGQHPRLATYDERLATAAAAIGIPRLAL